MIGRFTWTLRINRFDKSRSISIHTDISLKALDQRIMIHSRKHRVWPSRSFQIICLNAKETDGEMRTTINVCWARQVFLKPTAKRLLKKAILRSRKGWTDSYRTLTIQSEQVKDQQGSTLKKSSSYLQYPNELNTVDTTIKTQGPSRRNWRKKQKIDSSIITTNQGDWWIGWTNERLGLCNGRGKSRVQDQPGRASRVNLVLTMDTRRSWYGIQPTTFDSHSSSRFFQLSDLFIH